MSPVQRAAAKPAPASSMTPERHASILHAASRSGSWEAAEQATRAMAGRCLLALVRRLFARPWLR